MQMKDIEVGKRYATVWLHKPGDSRFANVAGLEATDFEELMRRAQCVEILEKDVRMLARDRRGVRVQWINTDTGEPRRSTSARNEGELDQTAMQVARIIAPWDEFVEAYHDRVQIEREAQARRLVEREQEQARRQEQAAKEWMERAFNSARGDLQRSAQILTKHDLLGDDFSITDELIQEYVDLENPDGNPYLNGTYTA